MNDSKSLPGLSANLKKSVRWIGESAREHPEKKREAIISEAQLRFDLTPRECEFLHQNFLELTGTRSC